jgi:hypothetical protein
MLPAAALSFLSSVNNGALCLMAQSRKYASYAWMLASFDTAVAETLLAVRHAPGLVLPAIGT